MDANIRQWTNTKESQQWSHATAHETLSWSDSKDAWRLRKIFHSSPATPVVEKTRWQEKPLFTILLAYYYYYFFFFTLFMGTVVDSVITLPPTLSLYSSANCFFSRCIDSHDNIAVCYVFTPLDPLSLAPLADIWSIWFFSYSSW